MRTILLGCSSPLKLLNVTKIISNFFKIKNYISWKKDKNLGYYLDINNAINNYDFSSITTKKGILKYLKK